MVVIKEGFQSKSDFICEYIERRKKELESISNSNNGSVATSLPDVVKNSSTFLSITDNEYSKDIASSNVIVKDFLKEAQEHINESLAIDNKIKLMNNIVSNIKRPKSSLKRVKTSRNYSKSDANIVDNNKSIDNLSDNNVTLFADILKYESNEILLNKTDLSVTNLIQNIDNIKNAPKISNELWIDNEKNLPNKIISILTTEDLNKKKTVVNLLIDKDKHLMKSVQPKNLKKSCSINNNIKIINSMSINYSKSKSSYTKPQLHKISMNNRSEVPISIIEIKLH